MVRSYRRYRHAAMQGREPTAAPRVCLPHEFTASPRGHAPPERSSYALILGDHCRSLPDHRRGLHSRQLDAGGNDHRQFHDAGSSSDGELGRRRRKLERTATACARNLDRIVSQDFELIAPSSRTQTKRARFRARLGIPTRDALAIAIQLAFLGDALERLARALDPILLLIAFRRQQLDDLERTAGPETAERSGRVPDILADGILVSFQQRTPPVTNTLTIAPHDGTHPSPMNVR